MSAFCLTWFLSRYILSGVACSPMQMEKNEVKVAARRRPAICDKFFSTLYAFEFSPSSQYPPIFRYRGADGTGNLNRGCYTSSVVHRSVFSESVEMFAMLQVDTPSEQPIVALVRGHTKAKYERPGEGEVVEIVHAHYTGAIDKYMCVYQNIPVSNVSPVPASEISK
ncbi:uncharacterized protein F5891DRAFT_983794 [Suillus fuscotomentosus]|uniref:Uncharacterized protein n=1 Tax=Suillus fuscotomentosus TaxID=1912939 RepID=A0AAD4HGS2_9AGAM|nr:uncharacterized protein F5891DRAFT_983794 [Suillus fuscotomentosus]KAG1895932.1 hypothetical protein F5891DRAFT_983794 [Suillus fuscotomentosus]